MNASNTMFALVAGLAGAGLCAVGCAPRAAGPTYRFTDPQTVIEVPPGQTFEIRLPSDPASGYEWRMMRAPRSAQAKLVRWDYHEDEADPDAPGGFQSWTFRATGKGQTEIPLEYVRPWERWRAPARTATFRVVVR